MFASPTVNFLFTLLFSSVLPVSLCFWNILTLHFIPPYKSLHFLPPMEIMKISASFPPWDGRLCLVGRVSERCRGLEAEWRLRVLEWIVSSRWFGRWRISILWLDLPKRESLDIRSHLPQRKSAAYNIRPKSHNNEHLFKRWIKLHITHATPIHR